MGPMSPKRSPRLPSPPPFTEVQFGPSSPSIGGSGGSKFGSEDTPDTNNAGATRRVRPGSRSVDMASGPPLVPLGDLDSAFQLQEHLKAMYHAYTEPDHLDHSIAITKETATIIATPPEGVDRSLWLYELCRLATKELNTLILAFFTDDPPCSAATCPEMRASEWQYLCAVHDPPKPCCAIDYCCHTLDWAANILTSTKTFPSRLTLGGDVGGGNATGLRNLQSVSRRLYRIFAHAWYQHRSMYWQVESRTGLYTFFKTICDTYQLIEDGNYTVPPEAEGVEGEEGEDGQLGQVGQQVEQKTIFKDSVFMSSTAGATSDDASTKTRRHKSTLSTGSNFTPVKEEEEGEEGESGFEGKEIKEKIEEEMGDANEAGGNDEEEPSAHQGPSDDSSTKPSSRGTEDTLLETSTSASSTMEKETEKEKEEGTGTGAEKEKEKGKKKADETKGGEDEETKAKGSGGKEEEEEAHEVKSAVTTLAPGIVEAVRPLSSESDGDEEEEEEAAEAAHTQHVEGGKEQVKQVDVDVDQKEVEQERGGEKEGGREGGNEREGHS
ncbi:MAG: hypothetical protein M1838_001462 [Thelocarpon superellum]|nr:MAG: hypothetical protein M1838_001462 [Thelocarpon superellum]